MKKNMMTRLLGTALTLCVAASTFVAASADYSPERALMALEFDGTDDTSNWASTNGATVTPSKHLTKEGYFLTSPMGTYGFGYAGFMLSYKNNTIDVQSKDDLVWETRIKLNFPDSKCDGEYLNYSDNQFMMIDGPSINNRAIIKLKDGYLGYGGDHNGYDYISEYRLKNNTWYTIRMDLHVVSHNMEVYITDDDGNEFRGETKSTSYNSDWTAFSPTGKRYIEYIRFTRNLVTGADIYMDYSRLWDEGFGIAKTSITDGAVNVSADTDFKVEFFDALMAGAGEYVSVKDSDGKKVPTETTQEDEAIELFFPAGLKYGEEYTVTISKDIGNKNGKTLGSDTNIKFTTEEAPFKMGKLTTTVGAKMVTVSFDAKNNTTDNRVLQLLTVVYDSDGNLVKMTNQAVNIAKGHDGLVTAETNVEDVSAATAKAYIWDGFKIK